VGAGASGRLALLDATEATPTFGAPAGLFSARFPGDLAAVADSSIDLEDAEDAGWRDVEDCTADDVVFGISASGETAYVRGALRRAGQLGALTALLTANPASSLRGLAELSIVVDTGPEAITGSTRLKAGTMTKCLLNAYSSALMIRAGRTYSNLMVDMTVTNRKLEERGILLLRMATDIDDDAAATALAESDGVLPIALLRVLSGASAARCRDALAVSGSVRAALAYLEER
jgi:N-acetylmuramic acid 6-phosphate etherase